MAKKVVVGMSGGVDSSVAAYLLKEQGYDVIGVTMQIWQDEKQERLQAEGGCCGLTAVDDARRVADALGIPYYVMNFKPEFKRDVMDYFVREYLKGRTPNPCIACNRYVKWEALLYRSLEIGADYIATGHYARVDVLKNGRYAVRNSVTAAKDQTYALYNLTQEQLKRTLFPVGEYPKDRIREIAREQGLPVANKPDSQEICFVPDGDYAAFIEEAVDTHNQAIRSRTTPENKMAVYGAETDTSEWILPGPGDFVNSSGEVLGKHKGITHYTIGQRRGLEIAAGHRIFVTGIHPENNQVVLGENEDIFVTECDAECVNFMGISDLMEGEKREVLAKIRYNHAGETGYVERIGEDRIRCHFDKPVRAVTPGQALVLYDGEYVLGGGTIVS